MRRGRRVTAGRSNNGRGREEEGSGAVEQEGKDQCRLPGRPRHLIFLPSILGRERVLLARSRPRDDQRRRNRGSTGDRRAGDRGSAKDTRENEEDDLCAREDSRLRSSHLSPCWLPSARGQQSLSAIRTWGAVGFDTDSARRVPRSPVDFSFR